MPLFSLSVRVFACVRACVRARARLCVCMRVRVACVLEVMRETANEVLWCVFRYATSSRFIAL